MAIKLGGNTNITLTNTSFSCSTGGGDPAMIVSLFTVTSAGNYHFEGNFTGNSAMTIALSINGTNKEIWIVTGTQNQTYDFTAEVGDVITLEAAGNGSGSNLSVVRYADEIKEIFVGEGIDSSKAMRGPCPEGFHVPTKTERVNLEDTGISLGTWTDDGGSNFKDYLKIPFAGTRKDSTGNITTQGSMGGYWSCTAYNSNDISFRVYVGTSALDTKNLMYRAEGCSIRPFKDEPVIPDSSWTEIFRMPGTPQGMYVGIYHNSSLGIISISDNTGGNWITIADKNLGATTVYNSGDTLSQSNCGNYFQRGNNYGFPRTGAITTSSTKADATNYGPGNYYSSSTFITASSSPYNWDSSNNKDLRGGETGIIKIGNVTKVYVGTTKVRPE